MINDELRIIASALETALQDPLGPVPNRVRRSTDKPRAIAILDEFSYLCFGEALDLWGVNPREVEAALRNISPDFLFVESAWNGNRGNWRYVITSTSGPKQPLIDLIRICNKLGIPTVFWNKEDPPHFKEFSRTAKLFDFVYTTEGALVPEYQALVGHENVDLLQFAASPEIHNPRRVSNYHKGDIAFGGQYFRHKFPKRRAQMDLLFEAAKRYDFTIYSRALGGPAEYQFPSEYEKYVKGSLPYDEMVEEYKRHKVFLNINSVIDSQTMCARRVFELSASKTNVVSTDHAAIRNIFGDDSVSFVGPHPDYAVSVIDALMRDDDSRLQRAQDAWRIVTADHLYKHRVDKITADLNLRNDKDRKPSIGIGVGRVSHKDVIKTATAIRSQLSSLDGSVDIHVTTNDETLYAELLKEDRLSGLYLAATRPEIIAQLLQSHRYKYVSLMRPDRYYGPNFLWDLYHYQEHYINEPVVSKLGSSPHHDESESTQEFVYSGAWLSRADTPQLAALLQEDLEATSTTIETSFPVYLSDGFSFSTTRKRKQWGV